MNAVGLRHIGSGFFVALFVFKLMLVGLSVFSFQHSLLCKVHCCVEHESTDESEEESENKRPVLEERTEAVFFAEEGVQNFSIDAVNLIEFPVTDLPSICLSVPTPPPDLDFI